MNPREAVRLAGGILFRVEVFSTFSQVATVPNRLVTLEIRTTHPLGAPRDVTLEESETEAICSMAKLNNLS